MCLTRKDMALEGDYYSEKFEYIKVSLNWCINGTDVTCKT